MACHEGNFFNYTHEDHYCFSCKYGEVIKGLTVRSPTHPCYACLFAEDNNVQHVCNWRKAEES